ncbi:MAG TPA: hypothetical protein VGF14_05315 [Alphaproteobacteria bacterium]
MKAPIFKNILSLSVAALLLAACVGGPSATDSITQGAERKGGLFGLAKNDSVIATTPEAFKGTNDVVIGAFSVGFLTQKTDSAKAGGGLLGNGMGGKSTAHSNLNGINDATLQSITDKAYDAFLKDLKAAGYNVVDRSTLLNNKDFAETKDYESPYEDTTGGIFSRGTITKYFAPSSFNGKMKVFMGDIPALSGGFAFGNPMTAAATIADKGGPRIIHAVYLVDFANAEGYGGWARTSSSIAVGQGLTVVPEGTKIGIIGGQAGTFSSKIGVVALGQPVTSDKPFADVTDATTGTDKTMQGVANVIGVLGGVGTNATRNYEFAARPADYTAAANDAITDARGALIKKMKSLN